MYVDLVFPNNNEKKFIDIAKRIGYDGLCFVYEFKTKKELLEQGGKNLKLKKDDDFALFLGTLVKPKQVHSAKSIADFVIVRASNYSPKDNRFVLERTKADAFFGLELNSRADPIHHKNSGINQVLAALASKNDIMLAYPLSILLERDDRARGTTIGRATQNIKFCRKYKVGMVIASFASYPFGMRSPTDLESLGIVLGMHAKEAKDSLIAIAQRAEFNSKKKNKQIIAPGIEIFD